MHIILESLQLEDIQHEDSFVFHREGSTRHTEEVVSVSDSLKSICSSAPPKSYLLRIFFLQNSWN